MNPYIDALTGPSWLVLGYDSTITYTFAEDLGHAWTASERAAFLAVFASYAAVCNITFAEAPRGEAELVQNKVTTSETQQVRPNDIAWHGWHDEPGAGERGGFYDFTQAYWPSGLAAGGKAYWLILHELGHGIGLEHPHSDWHGSGLFPGVTLDDANDPGDNGLNAHAYTAMSYRAPGGAYAATPMAFDIAALQAMYGPNMAAGAGNNIYAIGSGAWRCVWDAGGIDKFAYGGSADAVIDLRAATLLNAPGGGGYTSTFSGFIGGATIANGVVIENATSGSGDDTITGNGAANVLSGGAGNDVLIGQGGADILSGQSGIDTLYMGTDVDVDRAIASNGDRIRQFDSGEDVIDMSRFDLNWWKVVAEGSGWRLTADYDADAAVDLSALIIGSKPLSGDVLG